jgi:hypothetical protein
VTRNESSNINCRQQWRRVSLGVETGRAALRQPLPGPRNGAHKIPITNLSLHPQPPVQQHGRGVAGNCLPDEIAPPRTVSLGSTNPRRAAGTKERASFKSGLAPVPPHLAFAYGLITRLPIH